MPYWDHKGETQGIASPLCDSYNKVKMPGLSLRWTGLFSFMCPPQTVWKVSARVVKSVPLYRGDNEFSILTGGTFTFKTVSPTTSVCKGIFDVFGAHLGCLPAMVYSGRISGVCQQWCIQGASQVFASNGVFRVHLGCLPAMVYSGCISGVCLQRCIRCASQVFAIDGNGHRPCKRLGHSQPFLTWCDNLS